eukprot:366166-Chlamydomonas_euryale.AAC.7
MSARRGGAAASGALLATLALLAVAHANAYAWYQPRLGLPDPDWRTRSGRDLGEGRLPEGTSARAGFRFPGPERRSSVTDGASAAVARVRGACVVRSGWFAARCAA